MLFVVDTFCLIVLQRLNWLEEFLSHADDTLVLTDNLWRVSSHEDYHFAFR